jgi:hypothetical protein
MEMQMSRSQEEIESYNREFLENREGEFQDRLCVALERIADALEKTGLPTLHEAVEEAAARAVLRPFEVPGPDPDEMPVATVDITDNLDYRVATLAAGVTYGLDVHGGSGVRLKGVGGDNLVAFDGQGRTWLTVKAPCVLSACKAVACTRDAQVVLVQRHDKKLDGG